jgi:hypothetical protein
MSTTARTSFSRRAMMAASLGALAAPAAVYAAPSKALTPIGKLWGEAEALRSQIGTYRADIEQAAVNGVPGWMRLGGEANRLSEQRYAKLIEILNAPAKNVDDLKIIGQVSMDTDILNGARSWAAERFASAALALAA